eukprot:scaffold41637_cov59-Phaeocystis_antarctica.AAC.3
MGHKRTTTTGVEVWRAGAGLVPFVGYSVWGHGCGTVWRPVPKEPCVVVTNDVRGARDDGTKTGRGTKADSGQGVGQAVELAER